MPFLRFTRDRRGYETTVLMHAFRERGRAQPRILYWFRSPAAAKVGRPAIDEDAIRLLEEHHRDVPFDWAKILQSRALAESERPRAEQRPPRERPSRGAFSSPGPSRPPVDLTVEEGTDPGVKAEPEAHAAVAAPSRTGEEHRGRRSRRRRGRPAAATTDISDAQTPAARAAEAAEARFATAAEERFSPEDLTRLRGRYAALLARIDREVPDKDAAKGLRDAAEALNPDSWVTHTDVEEALEHYEARYRQVLDRLTRPAR